ncbi:FG-GAP-like repeat-containing protein [Streptomyces sp. NPDC093085]|uniref:FG-GAP-like repeat-containing protein n=1 Tax=Streptomyces sp. NPDC093085 TaxID=3155068 RepID=UPI0034460CA0
MALFTVVGALLALLTAVVPGAAPAMAADDGQEPRLGSWNMQGANDGTGGGRESRWNTGVPRMFSREGVQVLALQEAGTNPPEGAVWTDRRFDDDNLSEHVYTLSGVGPVRIYWAHFGQQRNGLAFVTQETVRDAALIRVNGEHNSRPILGVLIGEIWYFTTHALSGTDDSGGADAEEIVDAVRHYMRTHAPVNEWRIAGDFNRNPSRMPASIQRMIVRTNQPTQYGGDELDYAVFSDRNNRTVEAARVGLNSDHWGITFTNAGGCGAGGAPRSGAALAGAALAEVGKAADDECDRNPVPGYTYRAYVTDDIGSLRMLTRMEVGPALVKSEKDVPPTASVDIEVGFGWRPDTYKLHMGNQCLSHELEGRSPKVSFGPCDLGDRRTDWTFSGPGALIDPDSKETWSLGPYRRGFGATFLGMEMRTEVFDWTFLDPSQGFPSRPTPPHAPARPDYRLMAVGDSITYGVGSTGENGYRKMLWGELEKDGTRLNFVGSNSSGNMSEPFHDGYRGYLIDEIAERAARDVKDMRPNVVTLMAGTNDIQKDRDVAGAPARLGKLIDQLQDGSPGVAIVVATLVPVKGDPPAQERRNAYNEKVRALVRDRQDQGESLVLAEMGPMTDDMLADRLHPNDAGYAYMADEFARAIAIVADMGLIDKPADLQHRPDDCPATGGGWKELGRIAQGPINGDSSNAGITGRVELADFDGDGRVDYAVVTDTGAVYLWTRTAAGGWENRGKVAEGTGNPGSEVRFADLDGDGRADYLVVHDDGSVEAWRNNNVAVDGGKGWVSVGTVAAGTGNSGSTVRFADIDGDGRDDYVVVHDSGAADAWLNQDVFAEGRSAWKKLGEIAEGTGNPGSKVRLADLDGDGADDYLVVHSDGSAEAWLNEGVAKKLGKGWKSIGKIAAGTGMEGSVTVQFADADADGDADYFVVGSAGTATWWENADVATRADKENGFKKRGVYGDHKLDAANNARTVHFADLDGDGDDDYVLVGPKGEVEAWRNDDVATRGTNAWIKVGRVAEGVSPGKNERVVFADINGDGRDDYLVVDDTNGRVRGWRNDGVFEKGITAWTNLGVIAQGPALAAEGEVQFADIDGDGKDDYLVVTSGHSVHAWRNLGTNAPGGGGWSTPYLIASPKDKESIPAGQKTLFAQMNCDQRADYVLRDPADNNALYGWLNLGGFDNKWSEKKKVAYGVAMGFPVEVHLADLDGDGMDDYLVVDPKNGATRAWLNRGGNQGTP